MDIHTMEHYPAIKKMGKNYLQQHARTEITILSEASQSEKDKWHMI